MDAGNLVGPNSGVTELVSLQKVDPIYLYFSINAPDALAVRRQLLTEGAGAGSQIGKTPVQVALGNDNDYRYSGRLDYVAPGIDESSGTIQLRAILDNPDRLFVPGLFARVRVDFGQPVSRLMVPNRAVERDQAGPYVLVVDADDEGVRHASSPGNPAMGLKG